MLRGRAGTTTLQSCATQALDQLRYSISSDNRAAKSRPGTWAAFRHRCKDLRELLIDGVVRAVAGGVVFLLDALNCLAGSIADLTAELIALLGLEKICSSSDEGKRPDFV